VFEDTGVLGVAFSIYLGRAWVVWPEDARTLRMDGREPFFELGLSDLMMSRDYDNRTPTYFLHSPTGYLYLRFAAIFSKRRYGLWPLDFSVAFARCWEWPKVVWIGCGMVVCGLGLHWGRTKSAYMTSE